MAVKTNLIKTTPVNELSAVTLQLWGLLSALAFSQEQTETGENNKSGKGMLQSALVP